MILFARDWSKYPKAIADLETSNKSFIALADKYRRMGIKNYYFHLALLQPLLQGVDPFSPDLTLQQKERILAEVSANPWYYFREIMRIKAAGGTNIPLIANRGNIGSYWCYFNHIDVGLVQPRQTGKSISSDGIACYVINIAGRGATFQLITKDNPLRVKNVKRLKDLRSNLPDYINPFDKKLDADNLSNLTAVCYGNEMTTAVAQKDEAGAINLGRGSTSENNIVDEGPFCSLIHKTMDPFLSSANAARANAKAAGAFYGNIFTTTAGQLDREEGAYMYKMFSGGMPWDERLLYDCKDNREALQRVNMGSTGDKAMVYICMSHLQMGFSNEWLFARMSSANASGASADRDYFNRWTTGSMASPLNASVIKHINNSKMDSTHIDITERGYCLKWYIPQKEIDGYLERNVCVLGNDTSSGVGKDAITLYIANAKTLETVATLAVSETNIYSFIEYVVELMIEHPKLIANIERQSQGVTLIDTLIVRLIAANINPFKRIYNKIVEDNKHYEQEFRFLAQDPITWPTSVADKYKNQFGYGTSSGGRHARDILYVNTLTRATQLNGHLIRDPRLITELCSLVERNGRIDHPTSGHDDMVIAYLMTNWFLLHSKNLDYYGIEGAASLAVPIEQAQARKKMTFAENQYSLEQKRLRDKIDRRLKDLEVEDDDVMVAIFEKEVQVLSRRLIVAEGEAQTVDQMLGKARDVRMKNLRGETEPA